MAESNRGAPGAGKIIVVTQGATGNRIVLSEIKEQLKNKQNGQEEKEEVRSGF
jgi:hypothetical protein